MHASIIFTEIDKMAMYTVEEALGMISDEYDSGGELDIEEDPSFPLPMVEDEWDPGLPSLLPSGSSSPQPSPPASPLLS